MVAARRTERRRDRPRRPPRSIRGYISNHFFLLLLLFSSLAPLFLAVGRFFFLSSTRLLSGETPRESIKCPGRREEIPPRRLFFFLFFVYFIFIFYFLSFFFAMRSATGIVSHTSRRASSALRRAARNGRSRSGEGRRVSHLFPFVRLVPYPAASLQLLLAHWLDSSYRLP